MAGAGQETGAEPATADREIVISRVIDAPREVVFEAFTQVRHLSQWWGPHGFTTPEIEQDLRIGGAYRYTMQPPEGDAFHLSGGFLDVDPPHGLAFTSMGRTRS